ncbi:MAG TPA: hypothetical protein G4O01_00405 [Dehalococcoidia bacterium]|jgi:hypothetical protein|nr:hypothetical protein [Dehalococcoidia bacterium]
MVNWQITATTLYCDSVDSEVTILVYKDGSVKCVDYDKYREQGRNAAELAKKSKRLGRQLKCDGPLCQRALQYRDKLFAEEESSAGR